VHLLRHEYDAILVGKGTARADDPLLTDRSGLPRHRPLTRVVLDQQLSLSPGSKLARTAHQSPVLVYYSSTHAPSSSIAALTSSGVDVAPYGDGRELHAVLEDLSGRAIQSLLVEGGAKVAGAFLDARLVDKVSFFIAPLIIGGADAPASIAGAGARKIADALRLRDMELRHHGPDLEITGYPKASVKDEE
jgi:diaminohydroxyphosphoribosylaminopyrimidine deaminase/5-amino-6-(5-phosphoribosylamino)uracil reductase